MQRRATVSRDGRLVARRLARTLAVLAVAACGSGFAACASSGSGNATRKDASTDAPLLGEGAPPDADAAPDPGEPCGDRRGLQEGSPWPLRGGCPKRAGIIDGPGPQDAKVKWSVPLAGGESAPAVAADGTVWVGTTEGDVVAVSPRGSLLAALRTGGPMRSSPAIVASGAAVFGGSDGTLYGVVRGTQTVDAGADAAVDDGGDDGSAGDAGPTSLVRAVFQHKLTPMLASPAVGSDGTIYVGTTDGKLLALAPDGATTKWSVTTNDTGGSSPAIASDGTIYVGSSDKKVYAVSPAGMIAWAFETGAPITGSPAVGGDESIYVGAADGKLYALSPEGKLRWSYAAGAPITGTPSVAAATVYVGSEDKKLHAVAVATGKGIWAYETLGAVTTPAVGKDGTIYAGSADGHVYAITPSGSLLFAVNVRGRVTSAPAVDEAAILYVVTATALVAVGR